MCTNLNQLILSFNTFHELHSQTFNKLVNLKHLNLSNNNLKTIEANIFSSLEKLEVIDLSNNYLEELPPKLFRNLQLSEINLSKNCLQAFDDVVFKNLNKLTKLNLSSNYLHTLTAQSFASLHHLQELDLSSNNLDTIAPDTFRNLKKLAKMNLSDNKLVKIHIDSIKDLDKIKEIDLSDNRLKVLQVDLFYGLLNLEKVDLSFNKLNVINGLSDVFNFRKGRFSALDDNLLMNSKTRINCSYNNLNSILDYTVNNFYKILLGNYNVYNFQFKLYKVIFNEIFLFNFDQKEHSVTLKKLTQSSKILFHIISKLEWISIEEIKNLLFIYNEKMSILDFLIQTESVSVYFLLNLINLLQMSCRTYNIKSENNFSIVLNQKRTFVTLCKYLNVEILRYMFKYNKSRQIKHDFDEYFLIALNRSDENTAICVLEFWYFLSSNPNDCVIISADCWQRIYENKWWNLLERMLTLCKDKRSHDYFFKYKLKLFEYNKTRSNETIEVTSAQNYKHECEIKDQYENEELLVNRNSTILELGIKLGSY